MILRPKSSTHHNATLAGVSSVAPMEVVPSWLRRAISDAQSLGSKDLEDVALIAGAAIAAVDAVVRRQERWAGTWRQRLALVAGAVTVKQAGRVEDEAALRDAMLLTRPGDDVGPAGRMLLAWRGVVERPVDELLTEASIAGMLEEFGYACDDEVVVDLADELQLLAGSAGVVGMRIGVFMVTARHGFSRAVGAWLADALLAQRLGWAHALPLLGTEAIAGIKASRSRRSATGALAADLEAGPEQAKYLLVAQARAALRAIDLSTELGRRTDRLLAVAPRLRAKASDAVVERLLSDDAIVASEKIPGMSDRSLRRLFDRLVELGAVRELSGRTTFRIYGI